MSWKTIAVVAVLVGLALLLWRTRSPATAVAPGPAPPRPEPLLTVGQTVVLNAMGVGKVTDFKVHTLRDGSQAWGYIVKVRHYEAFAPAEKVPGLVWPLCDRSTADAMYKAILEPDTTGDPPTAADRKTRMMSLWAKGTHLEQAQLLGQVLRASSSEDSAIVIGSGHILREIASVLGIPIRDLDARLDARFPNWRAHLPERDPDDT